MQYKTIQQFINQNISNFHVNGEGWDTLIRNMLFEFCIAGWDVSKVVGGKEKFGGLRCYIELEDKELEQKIRPIVHKYMQLAGKTCEQCGHPGKLRENKDEYANRTLCKQCYIEQELTYATPKKSEGSKLGFGKQEAPLLELCQICGHYAVEHEKCGFCNNVVYAAANTVYLPKDYYATEEAYIKEEQIRLFLDEDDSIALSYQTNNYPRSDDHQILFTHEDLNRYLPTQAGEEE